MTEYLFCSKCGAEKEDPQNATKQGLCDYCYGKWMKDEMRWLQRR